MDNIKRKTHKMKKNQNGFTLIELLAVIIILGVLLLIAVPSISKYIENSRKNTYVTAVKTMVNSVATSINAMELPFTIGKGEGMIIPFSEVKLEKESSKVRSPYSRYVPDKSFILVTSDGNKYIYYISALDETGNAILLINEKSLSNKSITNNKANIDANLVSLEEIKNAGTNVPFELGSLTISYLNDNNNIIKIKVGQTPYRAGSVVQINDGSKWYVIEDSSMDDDTVNLVSYYHMDIASGNYGKQNSANPTIRFHHMQLNPAIYDPSVDIYPVAEAIISSTQIELVKNGIDMTGATVSMPRVSDFGCSVTDFICNVSCFRGTGIGSFWTTDVKEGSEWVFTISTSLGKATSESTGIGIRAVIKGLQKANIDKQATKELNK